MLEPYDEKLSRTALREEKETNNASNLPDSLCKGGITQLFVFTNKGGMF